VGFVRSLATLLFIVAIPIALVTTNVRLLVNSPQFYEREFDRQDATLRTGLPEADVLRAGAAIRDYFNNNDKTLYVPLSVEGRETSFFNPRETAHMRDVKALVRGTYRVEEIAVLYALTYVVAVFIWAREDSLRSLAGQVVTAALVTLAVVLVAGAVALTGFDAAFERFHLLFFDNDLWRLNPATDRLIQMFPPEFWQESTIILGVMTLVESTALLGGGLAYAALTRQPAVPVLRPTSQHA
jgi:integral membrane protein (TIGR01906 family)